MDSGLAAVLGATVGAVGTGGAGIIAALLARSQTRSQLTAEYARFIREPRKAAYTAYAEASFRAHNRLAEAGARLTIAARREESEQRTTQYLAPARTDLEDVVNGHADLEHLYGQVVVEGPAPLTSTAVTLTVSLSQHQGQVLTCLKALELDGSCSSDALELLEEKRSQTYSSYLSFLHEAAKVLGADGLRRLPE
ncbi:hypothetical protein [Streptomyces winkii]|uniref:hypothetical protein n=1 Tax=Streptomyces winkii TaxID=3051178 RepID=UPI0028D4D499|nr:hypothetical protein [Streptomyces sp. DSM 40971]